MVYRHLIPAAFAIDQLNEYNRTNYSLLKNGMHVKRLINNKSTVDDDKFERLREQFQIHTLEAATMANRSS